MKPNATRQALEIAGATKERTLFPVACTRLFGAECSTAEGVSAPAQPEATGRAPETRAYMNTAGET